MAPFPDYFHSTSLREQKFIVTFSHFTTTQSNITSFQSLCHFKFKYYINETNLIINNRMSRNVRVFRCGHFTNTD